MNLYQKISEEFGLNSLSEATKVQNIALLLDALYKNVSVRIAEDLNNSQLTEFNQLVMQGNDEQIVEYLSSVVNDPEKIINEEISKMKQMRNEMFGSN
jgi:hypothetical protein